MKQIYTGLPLALFLGISAPAWGQESVDYGKYPDYPSRFVADRALMTPHLKSRTARPAYVNNAETPYFPPIINQVGGSCGSASRIAYMFAYEINRLRGVDASLPENQYPTHFTWLLTNSGSSKDGMAIANGIPNSVTYGGTTYSDLFGIQDCADSDFGWMQGYDRWYAAMFNRLERTANFPVSVKTEEGREAVKNWLWNHNGDPNYPGGGVCGIGLASVGLKTKAIPRTAANDAAGLSFKSYISSWGPTIDHALTIVGYDDRVEFDLDGNGVAGEAGKDETGAWIIANSWGAGWYGSGFIYCPYKNAVTTSSGTDYYYPEVYYIRRNYRPLRTLKILMDYSHRSELKLGAGIAADTAAVAPEKTIYFEHFKNAGDGDGNGVDAATPMLGRWKDGLHEEPMEFGYDLTDLSATFDTRRPLKYFFIIERKSGAVGKGTVRSCSLMDYEFEEDGLELPFDLPADGVTIQNQGSKTIVSVIVDGEPINAPRNLTTRDGVLYWERPAASHYALSAYNVYCNDTLQSRLSADVTQFAPESAGGTWQVSAVYTQNGKDYESARTQAPSGVWYGSKPTSNFVRLFSNSGFRVKELFPERRKMATLEFWLRPNSRIDWNQQIGPGWGNFLFHTTSAGELVVGWDQGNRITSAPQTLKTARWHHVAIVVNGSVMTAYVNGEPVGTVTSSASGIGGFGDFDFGAAGTSGLNGSLDEVRLWGVARTPREIQSMMYAEIADPAATPGLLMEVKMNEDGSVPPTDATGHYVIENLGGAQTRQGAGSLFNDTRELKAAFSLPAGPYYTGTPVLVANESSANAVRCVWDSGESAALPLEVEAPELVYDTPGTKTIGLAVYDAEGNTATARQTIEVLAQPLPQPAFSVPATIVRDRRVSFINTTPVASGCTYEWLLPGAEVERAATVNVVAVYKTPGNYDVTLKATNAAGTRVYTRHITVLDKQPVAAFGVSPSVLLKGGSVALTDQSDYTPTSWKWVVSDAAHHLVSEEQNPVLELADPGVYQVALTATNALGSDEAADARGIVVCNADAQTGLKFSGKAGETVTYNKPFSQSATDALTVEWWMYALPVAGESQHIGGSTSDFQLTVTNTGELALSVAGRTYKTAEKVVCSSEWHHYAVTCQKGQAYIYKDGSIVSAFNLGGERVPLPDKFVLGGADAPMNAVIDELRVWMTALSESELRQYANAPIADVAAARTAHGLVLYSDFNQSSGDVSEAVGGKPATRSGFGPDGDAWTTSLGVFCLSNSAREDVSARYLTNYAAPFLDNGTSVSVDAPQFVGLLQDTDESRWIVENAAVAGNVVTGVCVDKTATADNGWLAIVTKSYDFGSELNNHKLYQTLRLPAGHYVFGVELVEKGTDPSMNVVAAEGHGIPDTDRLRTQTLSYSVSPAAETAFSLSAETEVSLGLLLNTRGQQTQHFSRFYLEKKISNEQFTPVGLGDVPSAEVSAVEFHPQPGGVSIVASLSAPVGVAIYNVAGTCAYRSVVSGTRFVTLPAGVYIAAGRKFIVR